MKHYKKSVVFRPYHASAYIHKGVRANPPDVHGVVEKEVGVSASGEGFTTRNENASKCHTPDAVNANKWSTSTIGDFRCSIPCKGRSEGANK
ncbi:hypothetical protein Csa_010567 [Cucumis sativus]|uniref:Uncharacterized protein n=1 Tax=Cucumis sativus TaxID=3659 RepID=A0A0A0L4A4_CUCSA|nr:hypothetical protein Csa_010567 [Cucumis sativus]